MKECGSPATPPAGYYTVARFEGEIYRATLGSIGDRHKENESRVLRLLNQGFDPYPAEPQPRRRTESR